MDRDTIKHAMLSQIERRESRAQLLPNLNAANVTANMLADLMLDLGWTGEHQAVISRDMPRSGECFGFKNDQGAAHLLVVAEKAGTLGTPPELHDEAAEMGFTALAASNGRDWKIVRLSDRRMLRIDNMLRTPEADRVLLALSRAGASSGALDDLMASAPVLADAEEALRRLLRDKGADLLLPYLADLARERGEMMPIERISDMIQSGTTAVDLFLGGKALSRSPQTRTAAPSLPSIAPSADFGSVIDTSASAATAVRAAPAAIRPAFEAPTASTSTEIAAEIAPEADEKAAFVPDGHTYVRIPSARGGRVFEVEAQSVSRVTLKAGSQITSDTAERLQIKEKSYHTERAHKINLLVREKGAAVPGFDTHGEPCYILTRDVPHMRPSNVMLAVYGTQSKPSICMCEKETKARWGTPIPAATAPSAATTSESLAA